MRIVKVGDILVHPIHGEMAVRNVDHAEYEEFINDQEGFKKGYKVTTIFDRLIPVVKWSISDARRGKPSILISHSYYLKNLELKE